MLSAGSDEIAGAQRVFRDLSKLGFEVEGGLFTAAEVGASHQRERIFIVAVDDPSGARRQQNAGGSSGDEIPDEGWNEKHNHEPERFGSDLPGYGLAKTYCHPRTGTGPDRGE